MTRSVWILCAALVAIVVSIEGGTITKRETSGVDHNINVQISYVYVYLLAVLGSESPIYADIEKILSSAGIEAYMLEKIQAVLEKILAELKNKSIDEVITQVRENLSSMQVEGGADAAANTPAAAAAATAPAAAVKEKKEAEKTEKKE